MMKRRLFSRREVLRPAQDDRNERLFATRTLRRLNSVGHSRWLGGKSVAFGLSQAPTEAQGIRI